MSMTQDFLSRYGVAAKSQAEMDAIAAAYSGPIFQQISIKTPDEIDKMRAAGAVCAGVLQDISPHIQLGVTLRQLNDRVRGLIVDKYDAEVDRLVADAHQGTGLAHTTRVSACFGLNEIVANAEARFVITFNLKHFTPDSTRPWGIEALHPDQFLLDLLEENSPALLNVLSQQAANKPRVFGNLRFPFNNF